MDLIPGKPDSIDTLLYALSLLKELFVVKLGYIHVMVYEDGKTVNLLYKIKDEYGMEMSWLLVMLGTWHLLKDYLNIFFKTYQHSFVRQLLSKVLKIKGNVDAIIACTTWWKSHNYSMWMISALIRLNIREFIEIIKDEEGDVDSELMLQVKSTVDSLKGNKRLSEEEVQKFLVEQKLLKDLCLI